MIEVENTIKEVIYRKVQEIYKGDVGDIKLEEPPSLKLGDYSTNISFRLARILKRPPKVIAEELVEKLKSESIPYVVDIRAVNGYINFFLDYNSYAKLGIDRIIKEGENFGRGRDRDKKIILEHTSANPNGPLHIGHGRNAIIGDSLKRILEFIGYDVETHYYVNDMGRQEAVVVFGLEKFEIDRDKKPDHAMGEIYIKTNKLLEENPQLEEEIGRIMREYERALENREDSPIVERFQWAVNYALEGIKETLNNMNIQHDTFVWESNYVRNGMVRDVIKRLMETGNVIEEDNVYKLDLSDFGIEKKLVLTRGDGTTLYSTRDIAYHLDKMARCDRGVDVLGADHKLTVQILNAALKLLNSKTPEVIFYEFISLPEGSMSTRRGRFITLDEVLKEAERRAIGEVERRGVAREEEIEEIARKIALGAIRYNIVRVSPEKPMVFKWEEALDFEKVGCPVIQYAHARCCRILEHAREMKVEDRELFNYEMTDQEKILVKTLLKFPKILEMSGESLKPHILANYMLDVAHKFNSFYGNCPILKEKDNSILHSRLKIVEATKIVIENGLRLLGIECPGKM
ncbi:MAG TPA: arginine--tRNA ligase [Methanococcaceae archaeon]|uniref:Arginine--tRNA ligase n=1 Tax=Methanothermococcus okinawensis TaxID=155863 RepID=A0A833E687_9EURY|nr:arginine--tRNA ligase [Methanococcaceae archaeon]HIP91210.1 arginine--tRNA ligase [Methanothermococcus okinawensis]